MQHIMSLCQVFRLGRRQDQFWMLLAGNTVTAETYSSSLGLVQAGKHWSAAKEAVGELRESSGCPLCPCCGCQGTGHAAAKGSGTCGANAAGQELPTTAWSSIAHLSHRPTQGRTCTRKGAGPCWQRDWSTLSFTDIKHGHAGMLRGEEQLRKWHCHLVSRRPRCVEITSQWL